MNKLATSILVAGLRLYQKTLSPDTGLARHLFPQGVCRYTPTCSQYMIEAIQQFGWPGVILGLKRLSRCHPFALGGHDPLLSQSARTVKTARTAAL